jgi:hypothetical protein
VTTEPEQIRVTELGEASITTRNSRGSSKVFLTVVHRENTATIIALDVETLGPAGHMIWTINKAGGRAAEAPDAGIPVGEIISIWVSNIRRSKGIANTMYLQAVKAAQARGWPEEIDHNRERTDEGERWAQQAPGGYIPARKRMNSEDSLERLLNGLQPPPQSDQR